MSTSVETCTTSIDGFEVYGLRSEELETQIVPALGAKILGLRDRRSGREWLWHSGRPLRSVRTGDAFATGTLAGSDECVPTVARCQVGARSLPDHGDVWTRAWEVDAAAWRERGRLRTSVRFEEDAFHLTRELALHGQRLRLQYRLENRSSAPRAWLWALHPLLAWKDGDRIELPAEATTLRAETTLNLGLQPGDTVTWPTRGDGVDFSTLRGPSGSPWYAKLFSAPLAEGWAALVNPRDGTRLTLEFDVREMPFLGVWLTRGGWNGFTHVALEPTNFPADAPRQENVPARVPVLAAGEAAQWSVTFTSDATARA